MRKDVIKKYKIQPSILWVLTAIAVVTDYVKLYGQMTSQQDVGSSLLLSENKLTTKAVALMKWKNESVFFWKVWICNYSAFTGGKYFFFHQAPIPRFTKIIFPTVSELCKDTLRTHCSYSIRNDPRWGPLWVLNTIPVVTLIRCVMPDVRIPEREERRLPRQRNSQKKGSLSLTRVRSPAARPTQWYGVREHWAQAVSQFIRCA